MIKMNFKYERLFAMTLDIVIISFLVLPIPILIEQNFLNIPFGNPNSLFLFLYLNKDFFRGKGIAKRIFGQKIINIRSNNMQLKCSVL